MAKEIAANQFDSSLTDWTNDREVIGTIGADLIEDKILIIDYPRKRLFLQEKLSNEASSKIRWADFVFVQGSILLPAILKGKKTVLYFDTGSSAFELLTDEQTWTGLAAKNALSSDYAV
jgi:hypothetical protein